MTTRESFRVGITNTHRLLTFMVLMLAILATLAAPVMAIDIFVDEIAGSYSLQLSVPEVWVKFGGTNGSVFINTETDAYDDTFAMTAGGAPSPCLPKPEGVFCGCQFASGSALHREDRFSGGGAIYAATQSSDLSASVSVQGNDVHFIQDFSSSDQANPDEVNLRLSLVSESAWIMFAYNGESSGTQPLGTLVGPYSPGAIDEAAAKYHISLSTARDLSKRYGGSTFSAALHSSINYHDFLANLEGWNVRVFDHSLFFMGTTVVAGKELVGGVKLFYPSSEKQLYAPGLKPYLSLAQVLPNGELNGLVGYYSYIQFSLDPKSGAYYVLIKTVVDENTRLEPGDYYAFVVFGNPGNDTYSKFKVKFTVIP